MFFLQLRMWLLMAILFAIVYAIVAMVASVMGVSNFYFYLLFSFVLMFIQYLIGPKMVEWSMRVRYIKREDSPKLYGMVEDLAQRSNLPTPRVCVSPIPIPNAFAFGRGVRDGRVCVTEGITRLLSDEELKAVLGHELTHIKSRDVLTITLLSVIPMIMYRLAWHFLFYGGRRERGNNTALIGLAAFIFYFITNLLVLYLILHLAGNAIVFAGPALFNGYSHRLLSNPLVVPAELGLAAIFLVFYFLLIIFFFFKMQRL